MTASTCPECGGAMEAGFIADPGADTVKPTEWVAGVPERSWFSGTRLRGKTRSPLTALRCGACGFVKLYALAPDTVAASHLELTARVEQLEAELARLDERERFLMELLQRRAVLPPGESPGGGTPGGGTPGGGTPAGESDSASSTGAPR